VLLHVTAVLLQEVAALLDQGVYDNEVLRKEGWVTDLKYEDEITDDLKKRTGGKVRAQQLHYTQPQACGNVYSGAKCKCHAS
jgi:hypothetical protein